MQAQEFEEKYGPRVSVDDCGISVDGSPIYGEPLLANAVVSRDLLGDAQHLISRLTVRFSDGSSWTSVETKQRWFSG